VPFLWQRSYGSWHPFGMRLFFAVSVVSLVDLLGHWLRIRYPFGIRWAGVTGFVAGRAMAAAGRIFVRERTGGSPSLQGNGEAGRCVPGGEVRLAIIGGHRPPLHGGKSRFARTAQGLRGLPGNVGA